MGILAPGTGNKGDGGVVVAVAPGKTRLLKVSDVGISLMGFIFADLGTGNDRFPEPGCTAIGTINSEGNTAIVGVAKLVFAPGVRVLVDARSGRVKVNSWGELELVGLAIDIGIVTVDDKLLKTGREITGATLMAIGLAIGLAATGTRAVCTGGTDRINCVDG